MASMAYEPASPLRSYKHTSPYCSSAGSMNSPCPLPRWGRGMHGSHTAVFGSLLGVTLEGAAELVDVVRVGPAREPLRVLPGDRPSQLVARQGKARQALRTRRLAPLLH